MIEFIIPAIIGIFAGFVGGLLGVGGSIIIIPGLIYYFNQTSGYTGDTQHLIQAASMICNFFISFPAVLAHRRAAAIMKPVVVRLIPAALVGIFAGVALSNSSTFARQNGKYLALGLSLFLAYVVIYNLYRLYLMTKNNNAPTPIPEKIPTWKVLTVGLPMGLIAGLLGIGGGALAVPAQQLILKIPLKNAIANSATTIVFTAIFGALYKNATLTAHGPTVIQSLKLAAMLIPTAMIASFLGGKLVHKLPRKILRITFIIFMTFVAYKTFKNATTTELTASASEPDTTTNQRAHSNQLHRFITTSLTNTSPATKSSDSTIITSSQF
ncbi:MAG: sulfite exporter TauE/SafE family protein [Planctomycetes bacterium]|nr:sulfite exporter TauE/SafE family protein [Planctomycetota bacterium]